MFFLAVNIIKKNCVIGKQGFSLFPFFVLGIVPIFANDNYTLTHREAPGQRIEGSRRQKIRYKRQKIQYKKRKYRSKRKISGL